MEIKYKNFWAVFLLVVLAASLFAGIVIGKAAAVSVAPVKAGEFTSLYITKSKAGNLYISGYYRTNWTSCKLTRTSAGQKFYSKELTHSGRHYISPAIRVTPGKVCALKLVTSKHGTVRKNIAVREAKYYKEGEKYRVYIKQR